MEDTNIPREEGEEESVPDWWGLLTAAEKLGCTPWELMEQPLCWTGWALEKLEVENEVQKRQQKKGNRKARK